MSTVLFEAPGPRTIARHRIYSIVAWLVVLGIFGYIAYVMFSKGVFSYELWEPFVTPSYITALVVEGVWVTLQMAFFSIIFAVVFGVVFGIGKISDHAWLRWPSWAVVEFFRAVPVLLLMIFIFYSYGIGDGFGAFWSVVAALTLYNGSVLAEVLRAGINAVPAGQAEAAYAIGMRKTQVMTNVLLPQAVKIMLPAIVSQCVVALKDTSLGYYIAVPGLTAIGKGIWTEFGNQFQTVIVLAGLYIIMNTILSGIAGWLQRRFAGERAAKIPEQDAGV